MQNTIKDKVSFYNIDIEYQNGVILYNSLTDSILAVSFKDYSIIETLMEYLPIFQKEYPSLYASFKKAGFIIPENFDELAYIKFENKRRIFMDRNYHLTINPTLDCNVKCWYCSVVYAGAQHYKKSMEDEIIQGLNLHIKQLLRNKEAKSLLLDWFGGEPLMYFDEVIKKISDSALQTAIKEKIPFHQQITTNGTLLNQERIKYMKDANFTFFQISMDGNEHRQNLIKRYTNRKGTYQDVIHNINMICEIIPQAKICLRINYDAQTLKNVIDIADDLSENSRNNITIDFQRIWQIPCTDEMRGLLKSNITKFQEKGFKTMFWGYKPLNFKVCYADSINHYVINYDGKIFKCTARDYSDKFMIGELQPTGNIKWNNTVLCKMFDKLSFENKRCEKCKLLPLCMGPCIQKKYEAAINNITSPCTHKKIELEVNAFIQEKAKRLHLI